MTLSLASHSLVILQRVKPVTLLLVASLLANVALVTIYLGRVPAPAATSGNATRVAINPHHDSSADGALRFALATGDAAALQAAGLSPELAREIAAGRSLSRLFEKFRAANVNATTDRRWWRSQHSGGLPREQQLQLRRDFADLLTAAYGDDLGLFSTASDAGTLDFLPPDKRDALRRITQDYDEMIAKFASGGLQLASDREKLRLLRAERDRDIAALLTPDERLAYEMRSSASGATVRSRYGDVIESEAEFQKIYALQRAFDEKYSREALSGRISPEVLRARSEAERQLEADLSAAVGAGRYATLRRAADPDLRSVDALASRLNLPATTGDNVALTRDNFAAESQRINSDTTVPFPQRRTQIQELATRAKSELTRTLGSEAAEAYAANSPWVGLLNNGMAYSTTPTAGSPGSLMGGNQSVYPVVPIGPTGPGGTRQMIYNSTAASPTADAVIHGGAIDDGNVRVMTFSTSTTETTSTKGAPSGARTIIVAPPPPGVPPKP